MDIFCTISVLILSKWHFFNKIRHSMKPNYYKIDYETEKKDIITAVIETPRGCRNKYTYDEDTGTFQLKKTLPEGMVFPYNFGFIPQTLAPDGDPADILVLMDEPAF